ncbi:type III-B CRISPR module RAMP protein Cmr6, partial [Ferroglobus sp.]|uniref:type III-B CRISPR module RAMP protein Cmr6 n=1 Tax=Ferroglobus sp. TaxID=2614230 RepID=UPI0025BC2F6D
MSETLKFFVAKDLLPLAENTFKRGKYIGILDNLSILLTKFCPFFEKNGEVEKPKHDRFGHEIKLPEKALELYDSYFNHFENFLRGVKASTFNLVTKSRLVVGLGDESVYEISIRLHRNYGVPYIPGSALKGVAKHYAIYRLAEELVNQEGGDFFKLTGKVQKSVEEPDDSKVSGDVKSLSFEIDGVEMTFEDIRRIFGTQRWVGEVVFFDTFPTPEQLKSKPILELDIMNPHYQPYYQHGEAPGDWHSPTPIFILTVPKGFEFIFSLAPREAGGGEIVEKAGVLLREVLQRFGVGAKTLSL